MIRIATCPKCAREIAAPDALPADDDTLVRCPHCEAEFPKRTLSPRDVPELIVVSAAVAPGEASEESQDGELELEEPEKIAPPASDESEGHEPQAESPIDMPVVTGTSRQEFGGEISTEPSAARTTGGPSFLRQLVGIVGGGAVGLAIGYFILLWIGGPEKDFLELGRHLPQWAVPGAFHAGGEPLSDEGDGDDHSLADLLESPPAEDVDDAEVDSDGLPPDPELAPPDELPPTEPPVPEVLVHDPPEMGTADLQATLKTAEDVRLSLVAGELSDAAARPMKSAAYQAFAALAEAFTFAEPTEGRDAEHEQLRAEAEQLLRDTLATERMVAQLGPLAAEWLDSPTRDDGGIVVAGLVVTSHLGIKHQPGIAVELAGRRRSVVVVGRSSIEVPVGSRVVAVGALVERPQERISGYTGSAPQVVWASLVEPVGPNPGAG